MQIVCKSPENDKGLLTEAYLYALAIRIIFCSPLLLLCGLHVPAQNAPNTSTRPAASAATVPAAYTNSCLNYIRTWEPAMPTTDPAVVTATTRTVKEVKQTTQYFDGLGRSLQQVSKGMSGGVTVEATGGKDL